MKPIKHGERWVVFVPARFNAGKRLAKYFRSRNTAQDWVAIFQREHFQFGQFAVTADERQWVQFARDKLGGDLSKLEAVLRHWELTSPENVTKTRVRAACDAYLEYRGTLELDRRTMRDTKSHIFFFASCFLDRDLHEITAPMIVEHLGHATSGWSRRTAFKHLCLLFAWAKDNRLVAINPMDSVKPPKVPAQEIEVYKPEDFARLLHLADAEYPELVPFLALTGFGMMRTGELIHQYADRPVMRWENVVWSENRVYVPEAVAKQTRSAAGNRRDFPLNDALRHWLEPFRGRTGRIVNMPELRWRKQWHELTDRAGVKRIDNGLRKSAISHWIACSPETGVIMAASWAGNSEQISKRYYLAWLTREIGAAWFSIRRAS